MIIAWGIVLTLAVACLLASSALSMGRRYDWLWHVGMFFVFVALVLGLIWSAS